MLDLVIDYAGIGFGLGVLFFVAVTTVVILVKAADWIGDAIDGSINQINKRRDS